MLWCARPPKKFWECRGQKSFEYLGEKHKSEFPGKHLWQNSTSEKVGGPWPPCPLLLPPPSSSSSGALVCTVKKQNNFIFSSQVTLTCQM